MRAATCLFTILLLLPGAGKLAPNVPAQSPSPNRRTVIAASVALDGRGGVLRDTRIVIEGGKIVALDAQAEPVDYDLRGFTVMPGWIDAHVHLDWLFGKDGKFGTGGWTPEEAAAQMAANARATLLAGFTTVQGMGGVFALREAIARGEAPGPRILVSGEVLAGRGEQTGTPNEIRAFIRKQKQAGADFIKIMAAGGMLRGGMTLSEEQLHAACDEAKKQGLRTLVHAYREAVPAAIEAGCTQVEHGLGATDDDLKLMAARGTYFDPQAALLLETYLLNKAGYVGAPFFPTNEQAFQDNFDRIIPLNLELLRRAAKVPGLKIVYGTDAVAGSHGRNAEDFIYRVRDAGVDPMAAMVSATSQGAEALGLGGRIGAIAPGFEADIIALDGNPLKDITAVRRVVFVMKAGAVYRHPQRSAAKQSSAPFSP